jgi:hypothetical protein
MDRGCSGTAPIVPRLCGGEVPSNSRIPEEAEKRPPRANANTGFALDVHRNNVIGRYSNRDISREAAAAPARSQFLLAGVANLAPFVISGRLDCVPRR